MNVPGVNVPGPLTGKRILVTRAPHQAGRLAGMLEQNGAEVLRLSTIAIAPPASYSALDTALQTIESFDWLVFTSSNAVQALADRIELLGFPRDRVTKARVAAIGPATARAAQEMGFSVDIMPEKYIAEALAASLGSHVRAKRVLLVRAAVARDVIPDTLRHWGAEVQIADAYQTIVPGSSIEAIRTLFARGNILPDAVIFTSSSTVKNFFALLDAAGSKLPPALRAVSIGPITTRTLREHQWSPAGEAVHATIPGLVEACERLLA